MAEAARYSDGPVSVVHGDSHRLECGGRRTGAPTRRNGTGHRGQPVHRLPAAFSTNVPPNPDRTDGRGRICKEGLVIPLNWYLILGAALFLLGMLGFFLKR